MSDVEREISNLLANFFPGKQNLRDKAAAAIAALRATQRAAPAGGERPKIIGRVTGTEYDGDQVPGMPGAICHACGLKDYPCVNPDCPKTSPIAQSSEGETIDDAPSCGQENDYRRARSSAASDEALKKLAKGCRLKADLYRQAHPEIPASFCWIADEIDHIVTSSEGESDGGAAGAPLPGRERMAEILFTAAHKGQRNCWKWSDADLDHEHPTSRSYWYKIADGALAELSGGVAQSAWQPSDEALEAHLRATGEWIEPHDAATECGVPIECSLSQEDADHINAEMLDSLREGYAAALALPSTTREESKP